MSDKLGWVDEWKGGHGWMDEEIRVLLKGNVPLWTQAGISVFIQQRAPSSQELA